MIFGIIKITEDYNRTKGPKTKLEHKINNFVEIATPKTYFQEAKLHKTHVTKKHLKIVSFPLKSRNMMQNIGIYPPILSIKWT